MLKNREFEKWWKKVPFVRIQSRYMTFKKHLKILALSLLSASMFIISWQPFSFVPALFGAFIPLLFAIRQMREEKTGPLWIFIYSFICFFAWNIGTTWWLWNATVEGAYAAFVINTLLMCLPVMVYYTIKNKSSSKHAEWTFIMAWLSFEYLHHTWEFSWPWLSLGNAFSPFPSAVQWYEYFGVVGGSFWVLYTNVKIFRLIRYWKDNSLNINMSRTFNLVFFLGFAPIFWSWYILRNYKPSGIPINVVVVQPNIDPYTDKFEGLPPVEQTRNILVLAEKQVDSTTQLVCFPETALMGGLEEHDLKSNQSIRLVKQFLSVHPQASVLSGADTYKVYQAGEELSVTARKHGQEVYYDSYNTALLINTSDSIQVYHKAKLVPGVESMPYQQLFGFLGEAAIDLGGTSGSLGRNKEAAVFDIGRDQLVAPVICYESVFGQYTTDYIKKGAGLLCIVTNDGWWGNSPGHRQHFDYARLRAIETRRYIARSANTGISGFIDDKGNIISQTGWWVPDAQKATLQYQTAITFYVEYTWYIEFLPVVLFVFAFFRRRQPQAS
jgi:apolipoprotein N-acyltransferase